jgi:SAM-dependent methyltransferase
MKGASLFRTLQQVSSGYRAAQILFAAERVGIFAALGQNSLALPALAAALKTDPRATRIVCDALVSLGLLVKKKDGYRNARVGRALLLPDSPRSQCALVRHNAALYEKWAGLSGVLRTGQPVPPERIEPELRGDETSFAQAMAAAAAASVEETLEKLPLKPVHRMLDLGGGPGLYAIACAQRRKTLQAVVFDNEPTVAVATQHIQQAGLSDRVRVRAGNAFTDDLGADYDLVLLSNVIHQYAPADNERLVVRAAAALRPGGRLAVKDFVLLPSRVGPQAACLFAVNMLVNTAGGDCYTVDELCGWLKLAGLVFEGKHALSSPSALVLARKPDGKESASGGLKRGRPNNHALT